MVAVLAVWALSPQGLETDKKKQRTYIGKALLPYVCLISLQTKHKAYSQIMLPRAHSFATDIEFIFSLCEFIAIYSFRQMDTKRLPYRYIVLILHHRSAHLPHKFSLQTNVSSVVSHNKTSTTSWVSWFVYDSLARSSASCQTGQSVWWVTVSVRLHGIGRCFTNCTLDK